MHSEFKKIKAMVVIEVKRNLSEVICWLCG